MISGGAAAHHSTGKGSGSTLLKTHPVLLADRIIFPVVAWESNRSAFPALKFDSTRNGNGI